MTRRRDKLGAVGTEPKGQAARGRPADPDIERRVIAAALSVYGEVGWAGFSLDRVARRAPAFVQGLARRVNDMQTSTFYRALQSGENSYRMYWFKKD